MKRDLLIAGVLVALAALGVGAIAFLPGLLKDDRPTIIKPRTEPIAYVPKKEEPRKPEPTLPVATPRIEKKPEPKEEPKKDGEAKEEKK